MNTLSARMHSKESYSIPHADFLRLQHAHGVGVTVLDMLSLIIASGDERHAPDGEALASVIALLTDQLGKVVATCENEFFEQGVRHDC
ncbi:hypothetical protein [Erwinia rhapontici]|uniref:hypothetical protein n=1 Tax=Erwinia rhapontici TaxID=55212 RepID=UPI0021699F26|nr:hypothetical protein [Erwinia rhapontici]MCS3609032.1 hypothetical protein [Erwinia rhapontici]